MALVIYVHCDKCSNVELVSKKIIEKKKAKEIVEKLGWHISQRYLCPKCYKKMKLNKKRK